MKHSSWIRATILASLSCLWQICTRRPPLQPFDPSRVRLLDGPFKEIQDLHRTGMVGKLEPDKLLFPFRKKPGCRNRRACHPATADGTTASSNTIPAEVCDTITTSGTWFWQPDSEQKMRGAEDVAAVFRMCNERRANYLLDFGPDRRGSCPTPSSCA